MHVIQDFRCTYMDKLDLHSKRDVWNAKYSHCTESTGTEQLII